MAGICWLLGPNMCPPKKRQFLRGGNTNCNMAINSTNYSDMIHDVFLLVIYIYISFVFAVAAAGCLGETKYAKRSEETEWILGALIPIQSYMCCSKLNTIFEMISDGSYTTNRRQIALLSWQVCFFPICFYLSIVHLSSKNGDRDIANLTHPSVPYFFICIVAVWADHTWRLCFTWRSVDFNHSCSSNSFQWRSMFWMGLNGFPVGSSLLKLINKTFKKLHYLIPLLLS